MSGCWVTWPAEIRPRHDVDDIRPHLDRVTTILAQHRYVTQARYDYDPRTSTVDLLIDVRHGLTEVLVQAEALAALIWALPAAGFATKHAGPAAPSPIAWVDLARWPKDFRWW